MRKKCLKTIMSTIIDEESSVRKKMSESKRKNDSFTRAPYIEFAFYKSKYTTKKIHLCLILNITIKPNASIP